MYKFPIDSTEGQDWTQVCEGGRNNRNGSAINLTKPHTKVAIRTKVLLGKLPLYFTSFIFLFLWCPPALFIAIFRNSMILFLHAFSLFCWPFFNFAPTLYIFLQAFACIELLVLGNGSFFIFCYIALSVLLDIHECLQLQVTHHVSEYICTESLQSTLLTRCGLVVVR